MRSHNCFLLWGLMLSLCIGPVAWAQLPVTHDLVAHFDSQNVVTVYDDANDVYMVTEWTDLSGNGNDAVAMDDSLRPALKPDGAGAGAVAYDSLDFLGEKALKIMPNQTDFAGANEFTWFAVYKTPAVPGSFMGVLFSGYEMLKTDGTPWTADYQICRTWGSFIQNNRMMSYARNQDASMKNEPDDLYHGLYGWNLVIGVWDPDTGNGSNCVEGDIDNYLNPLTALHPTFADGKSPAYDGVTGPYTLINHIGLSLGGSFILDEPPTYSQFTNFLNGEFAEVIIYHDGLTQAETEAVATYLKSKYNYGGDVGGLLPPTPLNDCASALAAGGVMGDLDDDCAVNLGDFAILASNWLTSYDPIFE